MNKSMPIIICLIILALLFSGCVQPTSDASLTQKDKNIANLEASISDLKIQLITKETEVQNSIKQLAEEKEKLIDFFASYEKTTNYFIPAGDAYSTAIDYYDKAGYAYEKNDWDNIIAYCTSARASFFEGSQKYNLAKAAFDKIKPSAPNTLFSQLIENYGKVAEEAAKYNYALYEACEHFESASRYYKLGNYDMGGTEIESMNKKVAEHDAAIKIHNEYLAKIDILLETG